MLGLAAGRPGGPGVSVGSTSRARGLLMSASDTAQTEGPFAYFVRFPSSLVDN
jgi:hypothetical protein